MKNVHFPGFPDHISLVVTFTMCIGGLNGLSNEALASVVKKFCIDKIQVNV